MTRQLNMDLYLRQLKNRYVQANRNGKVLILDEFCQTSGYHRKHAIRLLTHVAILTPVMRQVHKAGEKAFVDYAGMIVPWIDPAMGEIHEAQIFVGCLGASQFMFVEARSG